MHEPFLNYNSSQTFKVHVSTKSFIQFICITTYSALWLTEYKNKQRLEKMATTIPSLDQSNKAFIWDAKYLIGVNSKNQL